jgi:hypothetical protein
VAVGLDATAIDTHLTGAQKLLQLPEGKSRIMNLEPAIEAHARFAVFYRNLFYASHIVTISAGIALQEVSCEPQSGKEEKNGACNAAKYIDGGRDDVTALPHQCRIKREGREGGEAAKNARGQEQPKLLGTGRRAQRQPSREKAHYQAANEVHGERAPGKRRSQKTRGTDVGEMTQTRPHAAAHAYEKQMIQARLRLSQAFDDRSRRSFDQ